MVTSSFLVQDPILLMANSKGRPVGYLSVPTSGRERDFWVDSSSRGPWCVGGVIENNRAGLMGAGIDIGRLHVARRGRISA